MRHAIEEARPLHLFCQTVQPRSYSQGDRVEYRPIGGTSDKVTHSTGEIVRIEGDGEDAKYTIRNDNTGKETTYQSMNIVGPAQ
ncbi:hypothetical protein EV715DRAFT_292243 [Schizophyllum commune]